MDATKSRKFPYFPNIMVTQPLFEFLLRKDDFPIMTYGPYGISKTVGYMLYSHFSKVIN